MAAALDNLLRLYGDVLDFLREEIGSSRPATVQAKARDLYERMLDIETMSALRIIYCLVQTLSNLSKVTQKRNLSHEAAHEAIKIANESIDDEYVEGKPVYSHTFLKLAPTPRKIQNMETDSLHALFMSGLIIAEVK